MLKSPSIITGRVDIDASVNSISRSLYKSVSVPDSLVPRGG